MAERMSQWPFQEDLLAQIFSRIIFCSTPINEQTHFIVSLSFVDSSSNQMLHAPVLVNRLFSILFFEIRISNASLLWLIRKSANICL